MKSELIQGGIYACKRGVLRFCNEFRVFKSNVGGIG